MSRKWFALGAAVALLLGVAYFALPLVHGNCQDWYHRVAFIARELGEQEGPIISPETRKKMAIEELGAKPFYCN